MLRRPLKHSTDVKSQAQRGFFPKRYEWGNTITDKHTYMQTTLRGGNNRLYWKMNGYYSQLKDMKAEVPNEDKRVMLCSQMNVCFKELAKAFTTRTPDITYQPLCAELLLGDWKFQTFNLYEMNQPVGLYTISMPLTQRTNSGGGWRQENAGWRETGNLGVRTTLKVLWWFPKDMF